MLLVHLERNLSRIKLSRRLRTAGINHGYPLRTQAVHDSVSGCCWDRISVDETLGGAGTTEIDEFKARSGNFRRAPQPEGLKGFKHKPADPTPAPA